MSEIILNSTAARTYGVQGHSAKLVQHGDHVLVAFYKRKNDKNSDSPLTVHEDEQMSFETDAKVKLNAGEYAAVPFLRQKWEVHARWARKQSYKSAASTWIELMPVEKVGKDHDGSTVTIQ